MEDSSIFISRLDMSGDVLDNPMGIAAIGGSLYFADFGLQKVFKLPTNGGAKLDTTLDLLAHNFAPQGLVIVDGYIYVTSYHETDAQISKICIGDST